MKYWKFDNIEYQKSMHSQTLFSLSHLLISVDYQTLARLKIDWTCQILKLSSLLLTHFFTIYDWFTHFKDFELFCILLGHQATVKPESLLSLTFWHFSSLFDDSIELSELISLYFLLFLIVLGHKFKMFGRYTLLNQFFRLSNNKNSIKFVKLI